MANCYKSRYLPYPTPDIGEINRISSVYTYVGSNKKNMELSRKDIFKLIATPRRTGIHYGINFTGVMLSYMNLSNLDLKSARFGKTDLAKANN